MQATKWGSRRLSEQGRERIVSAVGRAEAMTSAEIAPVVTESSHDYPRATTLGAAAYSLAVAIILCLALGRQSMWTYLGLQLPLFLVLHPVLDRFKQACRPFIGRDELESEVEEGAVRAFYRLGVSRTGSRTGVLLYVSLFERKVWVLADTGVSGRIDQKAWDEVVDVVAGGLARGGGPDALAEAVAAGVERMGEILAGPFPCTPRDTNELPDALGLSGE